MGCSNAQTVSIILNRKEILYDIENYAFVEGDIMKSGDTHTQHQVFDITQDGNVDRVNRVLDLAYSECVEIMYPHTSVPVYHHQSMDNEIDGESDYVFNLRVPAGFSQTTTTFLTRLLHEYMVCRVLSDWLSITKPESWENWRKKMNVTSDKIKSALNHRSIRLRRTQTPF